MIAIEVHSLDEFRAIIREVIQEQLSNRESIEKEDRILTRQDIMEMFHIGETTVWKRMKDGTLPYKKIGRKVIFYENSVEKAMKRIQR